MSSAEIGDLKGDDKALGLSPSLERRVWRKMDLYILPVVSMFCLLSFLVSIWSYCGSETLLIYIRIAPTLGMLVLRACKRH